jgi:hypothetical protein
MFQNANSMAFKIIINQILKYSAVPWSMSITSALDLKHAKKNFINFVVEICINRFYKNQGLELQAVK